MAQGERIGKLFIISGPSGAGKGTLLRGVMQRMPELWLSISATTRQPRVDEQEGVHYYFMEPPQFQDRIDGGGFLEWAEVHGNRYGTLRSTVEERVAAGVSVVLEIDPQGAWQVKQVLPDSVLIFVKAPSMSELKSRLLARGSETSQQVDVRMQTAIKEMELAGSYDFVIINDDINRATDELARVIGSQLYVPEWAIETKDQDTANGHKPRN